MVVLDCKNARFVVQSGTGFLKSESFDGELGFKTDNVAWFFRTKTGGRGVGIVVMVGAMKCSWPKICAEGGFSGDFRLMNFQNQQIRSFGEGIPLCHTIRV